MPAAALRPDQETDLLRLVTVGSVDDGKSTLIGRLLHDTRTVFDDQLAAARSASQRLNRDHLDLALITDGLKAEREQGITIDVAYRHFATPRRRFIVADTPGHVQYTRNMATGASTANLALLLVDARNGVLTQTRRHAFIASLLGIRHLVLAVNKMDDVGWSEPVYRAIRDEIADYASRLQFTDVACIPVSALRGDNVVEPSAHMPWFSGPTLLTHLETVYIGGDRNLVDLRFPVQLVLRPNQGFRGYAGQVASGVVRVGDEVVALPSERRSRVKAISTFDGPASYAFPPQSVTLCLEDELDVSRGDLLVRPANRPQLRREIEAMVVWMSEAPLRPGQACVVKHLTSQVKATVSAIAYRVAPDTLHREAASELSLNDIGRVSLELFRPIPCDEYARNRATGAFIVIDPLGHATLGAGMIIDRAPVSRPTVASDNIRREPSLVDEADRARLLGQRPATLWLTGLSAAGKTTIARALERDLIAAGRACVVLDGDNLRHGLCSDLGFSARDRGENIRRVAEVARLMNDAGLLVVTSFISPYRDDRQRAREIVGEERFLEVFVDARLATCAERDPKGLYRRARAGEIPEFTGVSAPYEAPLSPALRLPTDEVDVAGAVAALGRLLAARGFIDGPR